MADITVLRSPALWRDAVFSGGLGEVWLWRHSGPLSAVLKTLLFDDAGALAAFADPAAPTGRALLRQTRSATALAKEFAGRLAKLDLDAAIRLAVKWVEVEAEDIPGEPRWGDPRQLGLPDRARLSLSVLPTALSRRPVRAAIRARSGRAIHRADLKELLELGFNEDQLAGWWRALEVKTTLFWPWTRFALEAGLSASEVLALIPPTGEWEPPKKGGGVSLLGSQEETFAQLVVEYGSPEEISSLLRERWPAPWPAISSNDPLPERRSWPGGLTLTPHGREVVWRWVEADRWDTLDALAPRDRGELTTEPNEAPFVLAALKRPDAPAWVAEAAAGFGADSSDLIRWLTRELGSGAKSTEATVAVAAALTRRQDTLATEWIAGLLDSELLPTLVGTLPAEHLLWTRIASLPIEVALPSFKNLGDAAADAAGVLGAMDRAGNGDAVASLLDEPGPLAAAAFSALQPGGLPLQGPMARYLERAGAPPPTLRARLLEVEDLSWLDALAKAAGSWSRRERRSTWLALAREAVRPEVQWRCLREVTGRS